MSLNASLERRREEDLIAADRNRVIAARDQLSQLAGRPGDDAVEESSIVVGSR